MPIADTHVMIPELEPQVRETSEMDENSQPVRFTIIRSRETPSLIYYYLQNLGDDEGDLAEGGSLDLNLFEIIGECDREGDFDACLERARNEYPTALIVDWQSRKCG